MLFRSNQIFPIFLMWESSLLTALRNRLADAIKGEPRAPEALLGGARRWWNARLERLLAQPGSLIWGEMKQNGRAISESEAGGGAKLYDASRRSPLFDDLSRVRLHLIGHSAGAIVHSHIVKAMCGRGWSFETVNFLAPAVRVDVFRACVEPALRNEIGRAHV